MSTENPGPPESEPNGDADAVFDDLARRAGAALRRPAPADGVRVIAHRRRRQQALKASIVGGAAVATLSVALLIIANRDDPDSLRPVDSSPATTTPAPTPTTSVPEDSSPPELPATTTPAPSTTPTAPSTPAPGRSLWVELEPGATAPLPPAPISARHGSALVWTGTELIVWGGSGDDPADPGPQDGAAFDPAAGTWRQIAPPPERVMPRVALWTGTEMLVWSDGTPDTVSAAYHPATDTWRVIASPPAPGTQAFWIGDAAVLQADPNVSSSSFVYDPATDQWRRLADGSWGMPAVWTGTTIIAVADNGSNGTSLAGYDPATDTWRVLEGVDAEQPVVIPGRGGAAATVAFMSATSGAPVEVLDDRGNAIGELAGRPAALASMCETDPGDSACLFTNKRAVSVGGEVLFWALEDGWAFDPATQTWRSFELDGRQPSWDGTEVVAAGDLLFAWGADRDGLVYRAATPG